VLKKKTKTEGPMLQNVTDVGADSTPALARGLSIIEDAASAAALA
jgi:hypothetical protein